MKLHVDVFGYAGVPLEIERTIASLDDAEKIGVQVGRAVRDFVRNVPMRKQRQSAHVTIHAQWAEAEQREPKPRKRKAKPAEEKSSAAAA
jgi:hypothetical protein